MVGFGYTPKRDGTLTSILSGLCETGHMMATMRSGTVTAQEYMERPPAVIEQNALSQTEEEKEITIAYKTASNIQDLPEDRIRIDGYERERLRRQDLAYQVYRATGRRPTAADLDLYGQRSVQEKMRDRAHYLKAGEHLASAPNPEGRPDFVAIMQMGQEEIASAYGIPRSRLSSTVGAHVSQHAPGQTDTFHQTVMEWKLCMGRLMTEVYRMIFGAGDVETVTEKYLADKARRRPDTDADEDAILHKLQVENKVKIHLPMSPDEDFESLLQKYCFSIIDWATFQETALRISHLPPPKGAARGQDPWPEALKRMLMSNMLAGTPLGIADSPREKRGRDEEGDRDPSPAKKPDRGTH